MERKEVKEVDQKQYPDWASASNRIKHRAAGYLYEQEAEDVYLGYIEDLGGKKWQIRAEVSQNRDLDYLLEYQVLDSTWTGPSSITAEKTGTSTFRGYLEVPGHLGEWYSFTFIPRQSRFHNPKCAFKIRAVCKNQYNKPHGTVGFVRLTNVDGKTVSEWVASS